tara:strand:+ start:800 stop:1063 length:264 start_codon:yes stop_codon:yes gene_type:complete
VANHKSAKKRIRQTEKRRTNNRWKTTRVRTQVKALRGLIEEGKKDEALKLLPVVQGLMDKLAKSSAMKKASAGRKVSRLAAQVSRLS